MDPTAAAQQAGDTTGVNFSGFLTSAKSRLDMYVFRCEKVPRAVSSWLLS